MPRPEQTLATKGAIWRALAVAVAIACLTACTPSAAGSPTAAPRQSPAPTASTDPSVLASPVDSPTVAPSDSPSPTATPAPKPSPAVTPSPTPVGLRTAPPVHVTPSPRPAALLCGLYKGPAVGPPPPVTPSSDRVVRVFLECDMDKDGNPGGALDANEGPLPGVSVTMRCTAPDILQTHVTGANGAATFTGLAGTTDCVMSAVKTGWFMSAMFPNLSVPPSWPGGVAPGVTYFDLFMAPS